MILHRRKKLALGLPLAMTVAFCLLILNGIYPKLYFTSHWLNEFFFFFALCLPPAAIISVFNQVHFCSRKWLQMSIRVGLVLLLCLFVLIGVLAALVQLLPLSEESITTAHVDGYQVVVYRYDCGAPCGFSLVIYQERTLIPGLKLVRRLGDYDPAGEARLEVISDNEVRVTIDPFDTQPNSQQMQTYHLKRFIYF